MTCFLLRDYSILHKKGTTFEPLQPLNLANELRLDLWTWPSAQHARLGYGLRCEGNCAVFQVRRAEWVPSYLQPACIELFGEEGITCWGLFWLPAPTWVLSTLPGLLGVITLWVWYMLTIGAQQVQAARMHGAHQEIQWGRGGKDTLFSKRLGRKSSNFS